MAQVLLLLCVWFCFLSVSVNPLSFSLFLYFLYNRNQVLIDELEAKQHAKQHQQDDVDDDNIPPLTSNEIQEAKIVASLYREQLRELDFLIKTARCCLDFVSRLFFILLDLCYFFFLLLKLFNF